MVDLTPNMIEACYLAGPIDAVTLEEARDWQEYLSFHATNVLFFSPAHPFMNASIENAAVLDEVNRAAIDACKCLCAYLPPDRPAFGTIREIEYSATTKGYPTIVIAPGLKSLLRYDLTVVETIETAAQLLSRMGPTD